MGDTPEGVNMKREILFRGKRIDNGEWESGSLVRVRMGCSDERVYIADKMTGYLTPVIPETVCQYTGLKDKNGNEIYESDIVTGLFNHTNIIGHIVYGSDATFFIERKGLYGIGLNNAEDWLEVVGNIHEEEK
jgi:uncharacterized phage protein (TIGR01671 family)